MGVAKGHARDRHLFQDRGLHHKSADQCVLGTGHPRMHLVLDRAVALAGPKTRDRLTSQTIPLLGTCPARSVRASASRWRCAPEALSRVGARSRISARKLSNGTTRAII